MRKAKSGVEGEEVGVGVAFLCESSKVERLAPLVACEKPKGMRPVSAKERGLCLVVASIDLAIASLPRWKGMGDMEHISKPAKVLDTGDATGAFPVLLLVVQIRAEDRLGEGEAAKAGVALRGLGARGAGRVAGAVGEYHELGVRVNHGESSF